MADEHISKGFNAEELFQYLSRLTPEARKARPVFIRVGPKGEAMNVKTLDLVEDATHGFFGVAIPCIILADERFAPTERK